MIRIIEKSFTQEDIPDHFYVVTDYPTDLDIDALNKGVLEGVTGISDTGMIIINFFTVARNMVLKLDGPETVQNNKLTRVMYDNPHYLVSHNLYALARIFQKESNWKRGNYEQIMQTFFQYLARTLDFKGSLAHDFSSSFFSIIRNIPPKDVNSVSEFTQYINQIFDNVEDFNLRNVLDDIGYRELEQAVFNALERIGDLYEDEGEWIVKNKNLNLPSNDNMAIILGVPYIYDNWKNDELTDKDRQVMFFNPGIENRLNESRELENYCHSTGIAFYAVDTKEFKKLQNNIIQSQSEDKLSQLMKRYTFL